MSPLPRIDTRLAAATGRRLVPPGPVVEPDVARAVSQALRRDAGRAVGHVAEVTGLDVPPAGPVLVLDRARWVEAAATGFRALLEPVPDATPPPAAPRPAAPVLRSRPGAGWLAGAQLGTLLAYLATRVLGQFDPFAGPGDGSGRLLLVAPNVLATEQRLDLPAADFRLWVCLHEETHRVQFGHAPWLAGHLRSSVHDLLTTTGGPGTWRPRQGVDGLLLGAPGTTQRQQAEQLTAVMSLLEGHAEVMMDRVGPAVVPQLRLIRRRFARRRNDRGPQRLLGRLLGLEAKLAQYREGGAFVRHVLRRGGTPLLNQVWQDPAMLPSLAEIRRPPGWVTRVGG